MQTNFNAAAAVMAGQLDVVVSAGVEMMSRVPMGSNGGDVSSHVTDRFQIVPQGISAELLAQEWQLTREALDAYSLESHRRALAASDGGRFEREIVPIELPADVARDDSDSGSSAGRRRGGRGAARLRGRRGAAPRDVGREARVAEAGVHSGRRRHRGQLVADRRRRRRRADRERGRAVAGSASSRGRGSSRSGSRASTRLGCSTATRRRCEKAVAKAGLTMDDMSVIEINEAFASVVLQTVNDLHLEDRGGDVNPNGGGISLGHPLGATGARMTATLAERARPA